MYNENIDEKMLAILYGFRHLNSVAPLMFWTGMVEVLKVLGAYDGIIILES
jgi:hypothetical protein